MKVPLTLHPCQHLVFYCLCSFKIIFMGVVTLYSGFNLHYLDTNEVKHLSLCLLAILWSVCSHLLSIFLLITPSLEDYVDQNILRVEHANMIVNNFYFKSLHETIKLPENGIFLKYTVASRVVDLSTGVLKCWCAPESLVKQHQKHWWSVLRVGPCVWIFIIKSSVGDCDAHLKFKTTTSEWDFIWHCCPGEW